MPQRRLLETSTVSFNELFGHRKSYRVPPYQRDYSWNEEEWEYFWLDLTSPQIETSPHYMGTIILQTGASSEYTIIDGQQRIATLSLLVLAAIQILREFQVKGNDPEKDRRRENILRDTYLRGEEAVHLTESSRLTLNENNDDFYQSTLLQLKKPSNLHLKRPSEKRLLDAFKYFVERLQERFQGDTDGANLASFITERAGESLIFIQIIVEDEASAYTVFETLNARGLELTTTDLLKNYLFSLTSKNKIDNENAQRQWREIITIIAEKDLPKFVRTYWNSTKSFMRQERLYKGFRAEVTTPEQAFRLLEDLEESAGVYAALSSPDDDLWEGVRERRRSVRVLTLFGMTLCFPMLLAAYPTFSHKDFTRLLEICVILSLRYNIISNKNPNAAETLYAKIALEIRKQTIRTPQEAARALSDLYVSDEDFKVAFSAKTLNTHKNKQLARYLLYALESDAANAERSFEDDPGTIEHILPENPSENWSKAIPPNLQEEFVYRLGNLTLLEASANREAQNASYEAKRELYMKSGYAMTNSIEYAVWTPEQIRKRQEGMAKRATHIWRIDL